MEQFFGKPIGEWHESWLAIITATTFDSAHLFLESVWFFQSPNIIRWDHESWRVDASVVVFSWPLLFLNRIPLTSGCYNVTVSSCGTSSLFQELYVRLMQLMWNRWIILPSVRFCAVVFFTVCLPQVLGDAEKRRQPLWMAGRNCSALDIWIEFDTTNSEWGLETKFLFMLYNYVLFMAS